MTREEFDRSCNEISLDYEPGLVTDEMFDDINFVYTWYPTISETKGKQQIALLYTSFGFAIIQDMYERASRALRLDHEMSKMRESLREIEMKQVQLKHGLAGKPVEWSYVTDLEAVQ